MVSKDKGADDLAMLLLEVGRHLLWIWPMHVATIAGRQLFDRTLVALMAALPMVILVAGTLVAWEGIHARRWGAAVQGAWTNEAIARNAVDLLRTELERHSLAPPIEAFAYEQWQKRDRALRAAIASKSALVPSWILPLPPPQPFPPSQRPWKLFHSVHHFLFRSVFAVIPGVYLLLGVAFGWRGSQRWWKRKWRLGGRGGDPEKLFVGLSEDGQAHYLTQEERNRHVLVAGTTGSGKTEALKLLARHDIESGRGLVFVDMKGDRGLAESLFAACVAAGRRDDFLYFTFEPGPSHRYNALASGDALAKRDRLMSACTWSPEPFYRNEAKAAASRVLGVLDGRGPITFQDLYLALDEQGVYSRIARWASDAEFPNFQRDLKNWSGFWKNTSGLRANLHEFLQLRDRLCVAHGDIDFREIHARNRVVYFELNSQMRSEAAASVAKLVLEDLKHLSGTLAAGSSSARKSFSVYVDEARNAAYEGFVGFISQCRSAGIGLVLASQSPLDFDGEGGPITLSVTQNTATKLIFCQRDPASASFCAELGGTKETKKRTSQLLDDQIFGSTPTGVVSEREVKEFHVHPDELKALDVGRAYVIRGNTRALVRTHYRPLVATIPFAPTIPRKWQAGDEERFGQLQTPLALSAE